MEFHATPKFSSMKDIIIVETVARPLLREKLLEHFLASIRHLSFSLNCPFHLALLVMFLLASL